MIFIQEADEELDYVVNFLPFLEGDTITSVTWTVDAGLTPSRETNTGTTATVWITGGQAGKTYNVKAQITTSSGRIKNSEFQIGIKFPPGTATETAF